MSSTSQIIQEQDKDLKLLREQATEVLNVDDLEIEGVSNITEFCATQKNLPSIPRDRSVCVKARDEVKTLLYNYVQQFKDYAYVGVIETDELTVEEEEVSQDVYQIM